MSSKITNIRAISRSLQTGIIVLLSIMMMGCSTKNSECGQMITIINQTVEQTKKITNQGKKSDPKSLEQAAEELDKAANQMSKLELKDEIIKMLAQKFEQMYRDTSKASRQVATTLKQQDRKGFEAALKQLQQSKSPEDLLVGDINKYCSQ